MITATLLRAKSHAPAAVSLGIGLGLAASWSIQRQQQGASHPDSLASTKKARDHDAAANAAAVAGTGEREGSVKSEQSKARGDDEPTLREDVSIVGKLRARACCGMGCSGDGC